MPSTTSPVPLPEVWGGAECTVRRVGDEYFDHVERSGHARRIEDLDRFAALGLKAIRYPVLWERTAPDGVDRADWSWADERLGRLRELGVRPIVGFVHHGSGPRDTSLVDPAFADRLAEYAQAVAERYPWVEEYTPVNEPLTTARFSGLYGHWYPHGRDDLSFGKALLNQCRAVTLSMRAIRRVNPAARLVQTEDLAKIHSTPRLVYQAAWENERRWLSIDLLCGRLTPDMPMWRYLSEAGVAEADLAWFRENPCPPDVLGLNYYLTSERFLDERLEHYTEWSHGGNGRHRYADVEAARARREGVAGPYALLREAWERFRLPLAVTEAHIGCHRESQLRWLRDVWKAATRLREEGADLRAVTVWSLLGAYDWNSLLVRLNGHYEPGVFDLRSPTPRPTALAGMIRDLAVGREHDHPVLEQPGWWLEPQRLVYGPHASGGAPRRDDPADGKPILIAGAGGTLGRAFARICRDRGLSYRLLNRSEFDIAEPHAVRAALAEFDPWAVVNAAGYVRVDDAESDADRCRRENEIGPGVLAVACAAHRLPLLTFSSDLVFGGQADRPYVESDPAHPLCVYGRTKEAAERLVLRAHPGALVVRTSAFFGPWDRHNFVTIALRELAAGRPFVAAEDARVSPTYVPDLVHACLDLLVDGESGLWHLANDGAVTWHAFALAAAELAGVDASALEGCRQCDLGLPAVRPAYSVLGSERGRLLPTLDDAVARFVREREIGLTESDESATADCGSRDMAT